MAYKLIIYFSDGKELEVEETFHTKKEAMLEYNSWLESWKAGAEALELAGEDYDDSDILNCRIYRDESDEYVDEKEYLLSLKRKNQYYFSIPFEYIKRKLGNDQYDIGRIKMEVRVKWDYQQMGYIVTYTCPEWDLIESDKKIGDIDSYYKDEVEEVVFDRLKRLGIFAAALVCGTGIGV